MMTREDLTSRGRKGQYDKLDDYSDAADDRAWSSVAGASRR